MNDYKLVLPLFCKSVNVGKLKLAENNSGLLTMQLGEME